MDYETDDRWMPDKNEPTRRMGDRVMVESTHAELEKYHYQEVKVNFLYVLDGMMDILREEIYMSHPIIQGDEHKACIDELSRRIEILESYIFASYQPINESSMQQIRNELKHIHDIVHKSRSAQAKATESKFQGGV